LQTTSPEGLEFTKKKNVSEKFFNLNYYVEICGVVSTKGEVA